MKEVNVAGHVTLLMADSATKLMALCVFCLVVGVIAFLSHFGCSLINNSKVKFIMQLMSTLLVVLLFGVGVFVHDGYIVQHSIEKSSEGIPFIMESADYFLKSYDPVNNSIRVADENGTEFVFLIKDSKCDIPLDEVQPKIHVTSKHYICVINKDRFWSRTFKNISTIKDESQEYI